LLKYRAEAVSPARIDHLHVRYPAVKM